MAGDYPRTLGEFFRRFPDDDACLRYLVETRWPGGFCCPRCGGSDAHLLTTRQLRVCRACRHQTSATAGTVLHRTRLPLLTVEVIEYGEAAR
jgi:Transposase zinc-ribbon domain